MYEEEEEEEDEKKEKEGEEEKKGKREREGEEKGERILVQEHWSWRVLSSDWTQDKEPGMNWGHHYSQMEC